MLVVVIIKKKTQKISRSSFACWELSRVNSFISFIFFGGYNENVGEDHNASAIPVYIFFVGSFPV